MNVINIENLSFGYIPARAILHDVHLSIQEGEYITMIGPNGVGKSTLLKCLNRIIKGFQGSIKIFEKDIERYSQKELGQLIGYVPQVREEIFPFTVEEFVFMGRYPYRKPFSGTMARDRKIVEEILRKTELASLAYEPVNHLSGGEQQKVYLAAALAQQPKILLLDEPTAHLDPKHHAAIQNMVVRMAKEEGITILHVTHDLHYISQNSQKVVALKERRVFAVGAPSEVLNCEILQELYGTRFVRVFDPKLNKSFVIPEAEA